MKNQVGKRVTVGSPRSDRLRRRTTGISPLPILEKDEKTLKQLLSDNTLGVGNLVAKPGGARLHPVGKFSVFRQDHLLRWG